VGNIGAYGMSMTFSYYENYLNLCTSALSGCSFIFQNARCHLQNKQNILPELMKVTNNVSAAQRRPCPHFSLYVEEICNTRDVLDPNSGPGCKFSFVI
jgi:hypothetical protein